MGQKINPIGFRLALNRNWASKWYANSKNFPGMLLEDLRVREHLKKKLAHAAVSKVIIERPAKNARITIHSARPGVVIGKKGEDIESLKGELQKMLGVPVHVNIEEVRKPETDAQLVADSIMQQLQKRIMFRRAMKRAITNAMRLGAQGIKIAASGRLNGVEIARYEWYREGRVPLHTLRADIDYGVSTAHTSTGAIGIKVWVFKGEVIQKSDQPAAAVAAAIATAGKPEAPAEPPPSDRPKKPRAARKSTGTGKTGAKNAATRKA
jgi:small subunit ribosomal protein S3